MENLIVVGLSLVLGMVARRLPGFPAGAHTGINAFVIYVALPSAVLLHLSRVQPGWSDLLSLSMGLWVFWGAAGWVWIWDRIKPLSAQDKGCLLLLCGFGNTSFVGFPLVEMYYGSSALGFAVLADQGTFIALATLGIAAASWYSGEQPTARLLLQRLALFPPLWAFCVALPMGILGYGLEGTAAGVATKLAGTLTPLALFSVGLQLEWRGSGGSELPAALAYKLLIAPILVLGLFGGVLGLRGEPLMVSTVEAAMGPMATAGILASQYSLNPAMASRILGVGILVSLLSTRIWVWAISIWL